MSKLFPLVCALILSNLQAEPAVIRTHRIFVPSAWTEKMQEHLVKIEQNKWGEVVPGDLYHGHLLLVERNDYPETFRSIDELFRSSIFILYHSDEMLQRWLGVEGNMPIEERTPRSIVGYWNRGVIPAHTLVKDPAERTTHFRRAGTIHSDELAREDPQHVAFWRERKVKLEGGDCAVNPIVYISIVHADQTKANMELGGRKYEVTMDCRVE